jgi:hypothetical protein
MDPQTFPDPFTDAAGRALQRAAQLTSAAVTSAQVIVHLRHNHARMAAERDEQARQAHTTQLRVDQAAARATWAPTFEAGWLGSADLIATARAWGAAAPYADPSHPWHDPSATVAMHRCEQRLRALHPYAMRRYDHLRDQDQSPTDAMREAAPFFAYAPDPRTAYRTSRQAITRQAAQADPATAPVTARPSRRPPPPGQPPPPRSRRPWQYDFPLGIRQVLAANSEAASEPRTDGAVRPAPAKHQDQRTGQQP